MELNLQFGTIPVVADHPNVKSLTNEDVAAAFKKADEVSLIRGKVAHELVTLELKLEEIIRLYFCKNDAAIQMQFTEFVLKRRTMQMFDKHKIFGSITKVLGIEENQDQRKELLTMLQDLIETRNILSHNKVLLGFPSLKARVEYIDDGKTKLIAIDQQFCEEISKQMLAVDNRLNIYLEHLNEANKKDSPN
jgi:hypothetical protein